MKPINSSSLKLECEDINAIYFLVDEFVKVAKTKIE